MEKSNIMETNIDIGLSNEEVLKRQKEFGKNKLKEEKTKTIFKIFMEQILSFTNFILAVAIVISFVLKDYAEAGIMIFIVLLNAIIGVVQENKAQKALEALKKMSSLKALVVRNGEKIEIASEELVPGDVVILEAGRQVPADLKLIETINLKTDEKALTGESIPVEKDSKYIAKEKDTIGDRLDLGYMSTIVTYGRGIGIVEKTGMNTQIGKIATMVNNEKEELSPLQKAMDNFSKVLGVVAIVVCALVFLIGILQKRDILDMLMTSVSLAVAAIPEGIPTIVTIVLALGMQRMAKLKAIVKTLPAVETLGSVSVVCSDKTGTLTQNKMTVVKAFSNFKFWDLEKETNEELIKNNPNSNILLEGFLLCNDGSITKEGQEIGDPTETALIAFANKFGYTKEKQEKDYPRVNEIAFDSDRKLMTTVHKIKETREIVTYTKGATNELLKRCSHILLNGDIVPLKEVHIHKITKAMDEMSSEALRVLSVAISYEKAYVIDPKEENLIFVGMVGMIDPEREEVVESVRVFKNAGVKTVMITGDHKDTALAIAKKLGIAERPEECIMGHEIETLTDEELKNRAKNLSIYTRVSPEHKVRIVKAIQANGNIVSMTGDGVNDAPSLKAADVGVAMGITGTDVAKGAADIILQDDSFTTIEKAINEGRNIYENIKKSIIFALSSNVSEVITMFVAIALGFAAPLKSVHILWVNLLTDSLPCFALGVDDNSGSNVMNKPPRKENESLFAHGGYKMIGIYSVLISILTLIGFVYAPINHLITTNAPITLSNIASAYAIESILIKSQTYAFCILAMTELFHAIGMRNTEISIFNKKFNMFGNKVMILAFVVGLLAQLAVTEIPFLTKAFGTIGLSLQEWIVIILFSTIPLIMHEILILFNKNK